MGINPSIDLSVTSSGLAEQVNLYSNETLLVVWHIPLAVASIIPCSTVRTPQPVSIPPTSSWLEHVGVAVLTIHYSSNRVTVISSTYFDSQHGHHGVSSSLILHQRLAIDLTPLIDVSRNK